MCGDDEEAAAAWDSLCGRVRHVKDVLEYLRDNASIRNVTREVTSFAVEGYVCHQMISTLVDFYKKADRYAAIIKKYIPPYQKNVLLETAEGMYVEIADDAAIEAIESEQNTFLKSAKRNSHANIVRETVLPKEKSYERARNKALEIIGDVDWQNGEKYIGNIGIGKNKVVGRMWCDGKVIVRVDWDYVKGPHINIEDWRLGKGSNGRQIAIPFNGNYYTVESLLKHLQR